MKRCRTSNWNTPIRPNSSKPVDLQPALESPASNEACRGIGSVDQLVIRLTVAPEPAASPGHGSLFNGGVKDGGLRFRVPCS